MIVVGRHGGQTSESHGHDAAAPDVGGVNNDTGRCMDVRRSPADRDLAAIEAPRKQGARKVWREPSGCSARSMAVIGGRRRGGGHGRDDHRGLVLVRRRQPQGDRAGLAGHGRMKFLG